MNYKILVKSLFIFLCLFTLSFTFTSPSVAEDVTVAQETEVTKEILPTSFWYNFVKIKEAIQLNLLTFKDESKASLLEKFADQRIDEMKYAESIEDYDSLDLIVERYDTQKTNALEYAQNANDEALMNQVKENALVQQQTMTQMQLRLDNEEDLQENIVRVQNAIAVQTKDAIGSVLGEAVSNEFNEQVRVVWMDPNVDEFGNLPPLPDNMGNWEYAPGTSGRNDAGVVIEYSIGVDQGSGKNVVETDKSVDNGDGNNVIVIENTVDE